MLKSLFALTLLVTFAGCDIPRPSSVVCDCQIRPFSELPHLAPLDQAPANFDQSEIRALFDVDDRHFTTSAFDTSNIHWYGKSNGESIGCVVFESSNHVSAVFYLSADASQTTPIDYRLMGIPMGHDPFFWERCDN